MNMSNMCGATILVLFLFVFLAQCRPHELDVVGTSYGITKRKDVFCQAGHIDNKLVYYCMHQKPKPICYDTLQECLAKCL
ncbi:hypothetical protein ZEAMMB73_Zm00001d045546 [Zea mays]|uniref:Uncharacterized protein n=1 Tax=Zea mays TaxID=4577 RepID=K7VBS4_MAIZE|nr:hypothetical protein ZEAMMB73_Zm00001d045546 [Zea mays]